MGVLVAVADLEHLPMRERTRQEPGGKPVKNIILMIGDGCGFPHLEAVSLYLHGENGRLNVGPVPVKLGVEHLLFHRAGLRSRAGVG